MSYFWWRSFHPRLSTSRRSYKTFQGEFLARCVNTTFYSVAIYGCLRTRPPTGGNSIHPPNDEASTSAHIYMFNGIDLTTRTTTYDTPAKPDKEKITNGYLLDPSPASVSTPSGSLQIEKPTFDSILCPPKSTICKSTFNPSSCAA
jgi:hypothetical protein